MSAAGKDHPDEAGKHDPAAVEAALLARARAGDAEAFSELTELHLPRLRGVLLGLLGARADVDDLLQDARMRALKSLPNFRGDAKFGTWFGRIATNLGISELRRRRLRATVPLSESHAEPSVDIDPSLQSQRVELRERLAAAVDRLPPAMRQVFELRHRRDLEPTQIARELNLAPVTVRTRLFHARRRLREALHDLVS